MFLDMQEHPEKYSDEQIEAMIDELDRMPDVETAWQSFERRQDQVPTAEHSSHRWLKVAAMFAGVILLSGIAFAAIHIISQSNAPQRLDNVVVSNSQPSTVNSQAVDTDTIATPQPKLYDNVPLGEIFAELSDYYHFTVVYSNNNASRIRLFYQWKPEYTLEKVVEMLNNFEWLQLELKKDTLFVSSTIEPQS